MTATVLIVDDSLTVRMDLAASFSNAGFEPIPCSTAAQARQALREQRAELIVLDVRLPDGDGVGLLRELRLGGVLAPVMMLSTESAIGDRVRAFGVQADEYIGKPYDIVSVLSTARLLLARHQPAGAGLSVSTSATVLVIDDSTTYREAMIAALRVAGYRTLAARTGEEGLKLVAAHRPHAVLVDSMLPGVDGAGVIRAIRLDAALRTVRCLLLTAASDAHIELDAFDSGADGFLRKESDASLVLARLEALLRDSRHSRSVGETLPLAARRVVIAGSNTPYVLRLRAALAQESYDVVRVERGEDALTLLVTQAADCVLLDTTVSGLGARETCRRLKASQQLCHLPVVLLTDGRWREALLEGLALGADDVVHKSAGLDVFKARVRAQLRKSQFESETRNAREQLLRNELREAEVHATRKLAKTRAALVRQLELKNRELEALADAKALIAADAQRAHSDLQDAYEQLQAAQVQLIQSAKMASLGELVAGVAHEINNPLAFVISHLGTVRRAFSKFGEVAAADIPSDCSPEWDKIMNRLNEMALGLDRIRELVVKLRTFSRLDEGERKRIALSDCVDSVLTIIKHRCNGRIALKTDYEGHVELDCYPSLLNQALLNLVANAIDSVDGPGEVLVSVRQDDRACTIVVRDTGCGIPEALRARVLDPFFTTKPVGEGTGLGLSVTYAIISKHGGTLRLEDAPGCGTDAVIQIPLIMTQEVT